METVAVVAKVWRAEDVPLTLLPAESGARCLDGSPAGFYLDRATSPGSRNKWALLLEGGNKCFDAQGCREATGSSRGSSRHFDPNMATMPIYYFIHGDAQENPHFAGWNRVYVPYCSQDIWSGTRTNTSVETFGLYFSGHVTVQVLMEHLVAREGMGRATDLVLGGYSAGGIGSWLNARYIIHKLPSLQRVVHVPIAGFFVPTTAGPFVDAGLKDMVRLWQSHLDGNCTKNMVGQEYRCLLSSYSAPYAPWRIFVIQAQSDLIQLSCGAACQDAELESWQSTLMHALRVGLKATDGWFAPACFMHHMFDAKKGPWILDPAAREERSYLEALWSFYNGAEVRLADTCGTECGKCFDAAR